MISQLKQCLYVLVLFSLISTSSATAQVSVVFKNWSGRAKDIVYDRHRDVIYASVVSTTGSPNADSILVLDPDTLNILDRIFVGSEPNKLAISNDSSRVYVAIDGETSFRYYEPETGQLGPLQPVRGITFNSAPGGPAVVEDMVVSPTDPKVVIVSSDTLGSSASGNIEIFNDTGRIGGLAKAYEPNSIVFVDQDTLIGLENSNTGFEATRFKFDNMELSLEQEAGNVIGGLDTTIEASGGLIFTTNGFVMDPTNLTRLGTFEESGAVEASVADGLVYFADRFGLKVYDATTFLRVDTHPIEHPTEPLSGAVTLDFAGKDRLAYVRYDGAVGVISGVQLTPPPRPEIHLGGTVGDDQLVFDLANREYTLNGITTSVPVEFGKFRFNGFGGQDTVRYLGDGNDSELAVLRSDFFSVAAENFFFSARNCNDVEFVSESDDDIAIFFDSVDEDDVIVTPGKIVMRNNLAKLVATSVARGFVYSQGGDDNIRFQGGRLTERLAASLRNRRIAFSNQNFYVNSRGFLKAQVNAGISNDDSGSVLDSAGDDFYYAVGDFGYFFNDEGVEYSFKEVENLNIRSTTGNDIGALQQTADSSVRGNSVWSLMSGPGFNHNLFNFGRVDVREP